MERQKKTFKDCKKIQNSRTPKRLQKLTFIKIDAFDFHH